MKTIAILSPRILLSIQLLKTCIDDLAAHKLQFNLINLNSGELDQATVNRFFKENGLDPSKIHNTTSPRALKEYYEDSLKSGAKLLLISSTYNSAPRLREAGIPIDLVFNDEAQYLVGEQFQDCFGLGTYQFSFTATQKVTDSPHGRGMDNAGLFGDIVYTKSPKSLIAAGEIVPPAIHIVDTLDGRVHIADDDYESLASCMVESFLKHEEKVEAYSISPGVIGPKLLITCDGQLTLKAILDTQAFSEFQENNPDVKLFALSSDYGIRMNGTTGKDSPKRKEQFIAELGRMAPNDRAIIIHVDMLAEGLDVPGITGIMPFRNLGQTKFLQTLGRATRLHNADRAKLYGGELQPGDYRNYVKPFAWVIIPRVMTNGRDAYNRYLGYADDIRTRFEFLASDLVIVDDTNGIGPEQTPDFANAESTVSDDNKVILTKAAIEAYFHSIEDIEHAALTMGTFWHDELYLAMLDEALGNCA